MRKLTTTVLAAAVLLASAAAAMAAPGVVTGNANVRAGAGTYFPVISSVQYGQSVDIEYCSGNWCHVSKPGRDGWVSASFLATADRWDGYHGHRGWGRGGSWGHHNHGGWNNTAGACVSGPNAQFCVGF